MVGEMNWVHWQKEMRAMDNFKIRLNNPPGFLNGDDYFDHLNN